MGTELTHLHYVNCPCCHTMFKPRIIPRKLTDNIDCVICGNIFILGQSRLNNYNQKFKRPVQKPKSKFKFPSFLSKKITSTEALLNKMQLRAKAMVITWIVIPMAVVIFAYTNIYNNKDYIAQNDNYRPYIAKFCSLFNCEIPDYTDIGSIIVEDNAIVSVPDNDKVIQLFAMINNKGKYDQKYPTLTVKFTDHSGRLIQQKTITPKQYIKNYNSGEMKLAKNSREYIAMQMRDPGNEAVNYEITLS